MEGNGWTLYLHPLIQQQLEKLTAQVETLQAKDPIGYKEQPATKFLATINRHIREIIPRDPNASEFRQGNTLGADNRHWFRAKFHERYRLFYRFSSKEKVIVYAWVNDESTLRKAGSKTDPYTVFRTMLDCGNPPSTMAELLAASTKIQTGGSSQQQAASKFGKKRNR
jgi:toxin YhaV